MEIKIEHLPSIKLEDDASCRVLEVIKLFTKR